MFLASDQTANTENQSIILGSVVVSEQAVAIGVTAVPTPDTDGGSDFHVYEQLTTRWVVSSAVGTQSMEVWKDVDSKAMRKVDLGEDLINVSEVATTGISEGVAFRFFLRTLVKLH